VLVLGIGNLLWADEGLGVRAAEMLADRWALPEGVTVLDGGTQGLYLLPFVEEAEALLVFDAVDYGLPPGTLKIVRDAQVPSFLGARKMSLHQTGFQDVLATAELRGRAPAELTLIGVQPAELEDYGGGLTPEVDAVLPDAVAAGVEELAARWGIVATPCAAAARGLADPALAREVYEGRRPSADAAPRTGDARFAPLAARNLAGE
jgi:hydrogenase maturation protease